MSSNSVLSDAKDLLGDVNKNVIDFLDINDKSAIYFILSLLIVVFIIFLVISWVFHTLNKKDAACKKLDNIYLKNNKHKTSSFYISETALKGDAKQTYSPKNFFDNEFKSLVKNYYVKTAYNCCCGDGYKNNFVNMCALEKCIELGARCLDFEIYSYKGEPIVAASTANNNSIKETYNYIKLIDVFNELNRLSFDSGTGTNCANDPMFLHFRIMSENKVIYDKFGEYIEKYLINNKDNIVDIKRYNYKNTDQDSFLLAHIASGEFNRRFIIMVHTLHVPILDNSKLAKYVHVRSGSTACRLIRYENVVAAGKNNPMMIDESHRSLIIVLPNINNSIVNSDPLLPISNGCQFVGMKFQNIDNNLVGYYKMFTDNGGFSFVLKPNNLRRDKIPAEPIPEDNPLNTQQGYNLRTTDGT